MGDRYVCRRASRQADATKSRKKRKLNADQPSTAAFRLKRAVKRFVADGLADPALLQPAGRKFSSERLVTLVAGVKRANPELTLAQIGAQLEAMYERTPRGGTRWAPSSVKSLLDRAEKLGLFGAKTL